MISELFRNDADPRSKELIDQHYRTERALADRLRNASRAERRTLYTQVYDELFQRVPHHPQLQRKADEAASEREVANKLNLAGRFLEPEVVFLEIGPGDCRFSFAVAKRVARVYAVDVSAEIARAGSTPPNFQLVISDGTDLRVPDGSIRVAYSNQLMEHLHPEDALDQLRNVYKALTPGGTYICITPNRISGPHDVSQQFDDEATGFHLKEYSYRELIKLFRAVGFTRFRAYFGGRGLYLRMPLFVVLLAESALSALPRRLSKRLARSFFGRALLGANLVATKPRQA
jgi:SAM-dependent methyltransferase